MSGCAVASGKTNFSMFVPAKAWEFIIRTLGIFSGKFITPYPVARNASVLIASILSGRESVPVKLVQKSNIARGSETAFKPNLFERSIAFGA